MCFTSAMLYGAMAVARHDGDCRAATRRVFAAALPSRRHAVTMIARYAAVDV